MTKKVQIVKYSAEKTATAFTQIEVTDQHNGNERDMIACRREREGEWRQG